jgi:hypothetical protein
MLRRRILVAELLGATFSPLIQEARDRQRRRRLMLMQLAALAAVLGLATAASNHGGSPALLAASDSAAATQADVRGVIAQFDAALSAGDFARACSLVDPWMGMATVRSATNEVGSSGSCEQRLAAVARILGPGLVAALDRASMSSVEVAGSASSYTAAGVMQVPSEVVRRNNWDSVVAVEKPSPNARVLITCPPLLCNSEFLKYVRARSS